jgi:3'-phosphoadenosine 5'-phosphosulfate sulfotransferase (PAPS reductase)/FAD synthetase
VKVRLLDLDDLRKSRPSGGGWQPVVGGARGGYRRKRGGKWEYWYPPKKTRKRQKKPHHSQMGLFDQPKPTPLSAQISSVETTIYGESTSFDITRHDNGTVTASRHGPGGHGATMPAESLKHFVNDLNGVVDLPPIPDATKGILGAINEVIAGRARHLGKGDDGVAYRVDTEAGDAMVVKVSTTVPYQPENPGHLTPAESVDRLEAQVRVAQELRDAGVEGVQASTFHRHGDKGFQVKEFVDIPEKLTRGQLDDAQDVLIAMHTAGYALNDDIQVGLEHLSGKLVMFDTGKAAKIPESDDREGIYSRVTSDMDRMKWLYQEHGQAFVRRDRDEGEAAWDLVDSHFDEWLKDPQMVTPPKPGVDSFALHQIKQAMELRRKAAHATLAGQALDKKLERIDNDAEFKLLEVEWAGEDAAKAAASPGAPPPVPVVKKRVQLNVIQGDPVLSDSQRVQPQSDALQATMRKSASDPGEWALPAGARVADPWEPKPHDTTKKWDHPEFGSGPMGSAPWHDPDWAPDLHSYDHVVVNSSAGKDSQAMLTRMVELADEQGYPRDKLVVVHADLGRVEWEGTGTLAREQAEHYGLRFEVVQRAQNDLVEQIEERHGDLTQKDADVEKLAAAGLGTWAQLAAADEGAVLAVIGEEHGTSKWPGPHRAKDLVRKAGKKVIQLRSKHADRIKKAQEKVTKGREAAQTAKTPKAGENARAREKKAQEALAELQTKGDPSTWPVDFGKAIAWPSSDARYCTSDHKRVEVQKLLTRLAKDTQQTTGEKRPARILNTLGLRAQESTSRAAMDSFDREKTTRNQVVDKWLPIHGWHESRVWDVIEESTIPHHKAYDLGMRRLSCVFCVFAQKEDLMVAAKHNPGLFNTYLDLEEKVGTSFKADHSLSDVRDEIASSKQRSSGSTPAARALSRWCWSGSRTDYAYISIALKRLSTSSTCPIQRPTTRAWWPRRSRRSTGC